MTVNHGPCHKCRFNEAVHEGQFDGMPSEDTPCGNCVLEESSSHTLPFNDEVLHPALEYTSADGSTFPLSVFGEFLTGLVRLPPKVRETVCLRVAGMTNAEIGNELGVPRHTVVVRLNRERAKWPVLRELIRDQRVSRAKKQEKLRKRSGLAGLA